ncbi:MAG: 2-phosphosulfolactate phosphatase [Candidatus Paceibacterota bacterium]
MKIEIIKSVDDANEAVGLTVVIDVFRAFSTEAFIFANNAEKIIPVKDLEDAYRLKRNNPGYILVGERGGKKPEGFDFGNGPSEVLHVNFSGKTIIHTTSNGTKGLMNACNADTILVGSFVMADSIIKYIQKNKPEIVSLVSTSHHAGEENEDILLAYYIQDVLHGKSVDELAVKNKLATNTASQFLLTEVGVPQADIDLCLDFHRFNFVIKKVATDNGFYLTKEVLK